MRHCCLGRNGLSVGVVAFGTCRLRRVLGPQVLDTLERGAELGVSIVRAAPDDDVGDTTT